MTPQPSPEVRWPDPVPQVGAVLYLDTEIHAPDYSGGKRWKLTGSCVLVAPDTILTVGHTLAARNEVLPPGHYAAFFPYVGLIPIQGDLHWEEQVSGDNLALATLAEPVRFWLPLSPYYESTPGFKRMEKAWVCGYGIWRSSPLGDLGGLQQQHLVSLGPPPQKWLHYDRLDVSWSSERHGGMAMGRGNSGGPLLWSDHQLVVGINREVVGDQQAASWITHDRDKWLKDALSQAVQAPPPLSPPKTAWKLLEIAEQDVITRFDVPQGTTTVRATLNASPGLRLRMDLPGDPNTNTGRFLSREASVLQGTQDIVITLGRAPRSPYKAGQKVLAQICVLFE